MGELSYAVPPAELARLLRQVSDIFSEEPAAILSTSRLPRTVESRWVLFLALQDLGYGPAAIGAACKRDHSTVVHGLARAKRRPLLLALAQDITGCRAPAYLPRGLAGYGLPVAAPVLAYMRALTGPSVLSAEALHGLRLIARNPCLQLSCARILNDRNLQHLLPTIRSHAMQLGAEWY